MSKKAENNREPLVKAHVLGSGNTDIPTSNALSDVDKQASTLFKSAGALEPPLEPLRLCKLFEESNSLRQNVDAYVNNIDGFGHRYEPSVDLRDDDSDEIIRNALYLDRLSEAQREAFENGTEPVDPDEAGDEEVKAKRTEISKMMRREKAHLDNFFEHCCGDTSFVTLRRKTRQDIEVLGNGYWEVLRDHSGRIARFNYLPAFTMRLLPAKPVVINRRIKRSLLSFEEVEEVKLLRNFVQVHNGHRRFFKEFGDPNVISANTGKRYKDADELQRAEADEREGVRALAATEILHFKLHSPRSAYGIPRWVGNLLSVVGSRQSEEVNFLYFENKSVPPMAVLVSGGRLSNETVTRIQDYVEKHIKGGGNFHKILVLEAETQDDILHNGQSGQMKIELVPLTAAQHNDGLFQHYDERNIDKVGQSFRLPRLLRGDIRDFNRSTAQSALEFAEQQVFQPERQEFDYMMNKLVLSELNVKYWKFRSDGPVTRDPTVMSEIVKRLENVLTVEELRDIAGDIVNRDFKKIDAAWAKQPLQLTLAGVLMDLTDGQSMPSDDNGLTDLEDGIVGDETPDDIGTPKPGSISKRKRELILQKQASNLLKIRTALKQESKKEDTKAFFDGEDE